MDSAYYQAQPGSPEHYAAYEKEFDVQHGIGFPVENDPRASYEIDNAYELALDDYYDWCAGQALAAADAAAETEPEPRALPWYELEPEAEPW
jgi:hypothetical protein